MKETEQTLFLKSNILHIRTNEGEFKVSNPQGALSLLSLGSKKDLYDGKNIEWPGGVEFETIAPHPECNKARECLQLTNGLNCSQAYNARTRSTSLCAKAYKLARLIPEEKKDDQPMSFTESAYKEFEAKDSDSGDGLFTIGSNNRETKVEASEPQEKPVLFSVYQKPNIDPSENIVEEAAPMNHQVNHVRCMDLLNKCYWNMMTFVPSDKTMSHAEWMDCLNELELFRTEHPPTKFSNVKNPVSAPSESQEEIFDDLWDDILKWYEEDNPEIDWYTKRHELKKKFTITRNP